MSDFLGDLIGRSLGQTTLVKPRRSPFFAPTPHLPGDLGPGVARVPSVDELNLPLQRAEVDATLEPILVERDAPEMPRRNQDQQPAAGAGGFTTDRPLGEMRNDSFPTNRAGMPAPLPPERPYLPAPQTAAEPPATHAHIRRRSDSPAPDRAVTLREQTQVPVGAAQSAPRPRPENINVNPAAAVQTSPSQEVPGDVQPAGVTHRPVAGVQGAALSGSQQTPVPDLPPAGAGASLPHPMKPAPRTDPSPPPSTGRMSSHDNRERQPESTPVTPARRASNRARAAAADGPPVVARDRPSPADEDSPPRTMPVSPRSPQSAGEPPSPLSRAAQPAPTRVTPAARTSNRARTLVVDVSETAGFDRQASIGNPAQRGVTPAASSLPPPASTGAATASATLQPVVTGISLARPVAPVNPDVTAQAIRPVPGSIANVVSPAPIRRAPPENRARLSNTPPRPETRVDPPAASQGSRPVVVRVAPPAGQTIPEPSAPVPPTINVTIGRIEVRATPSPAPTARKQSAAPVMTLDEYMRSRSGGQR